MAHFFGNCVLLFILGVIVVMIIATIVLPPILAWQSLRSGSVGLNQWVFRRSRQPIRYWLTMLTIVPYLLWMSFQADWHFIVQPLWHLLIRR